MKGYKLEVEKLQNLVAELEKGNFAVEKLVELEEVTRNLHEKSIILRYKAFENQVSEPAAEVKAEETVIEEVIAEEPEIDFSMFNDTVEEEKETPIFEPFADTIEENKEEVTSAVEEVETVVENVIEEVIEEVKEVVGEIKETLTNKGDQTVEAKPDLGSVNQFQDNSIAAQFSGSKLDTLIGAFGINQRLGFINNLFDGSSDSFSTAIKELDSKLSIDEANVFLNELSAKYEWEMEEEDVIEFQSYVNRRYA